MRSVLDQLDGDQAVLLLYLAGELPPADRAAVEQRFASDDQLRALLEALRAEQQQISQMLDGLDASQPVPGSETSSQRAILRMIKQWQADELRRSRQSRIERRARSKWIWTGPAVAAAVLLIGIGVWWGMQPDKYNPIPSAGSDATFDISDALAADVTGDEDSGDNQADAAVDVDPSMDDSTVYAKMFADVAYVQTLAEWTK